MIIEMDPHSFLGVSYDTLILAKYVVGRIILISMLIRIYRLIVNDIQTGNWVNGCGLFCGAKALIIIILLPVIYLKLALILVGVVIGEQECFLVFL